MLGVLDRTGSNPPGVEFSRSASASAPRDYMNKRNLQLARHANTYRGWVTIVKRFRLSDKLKGLA